MGHDSTCSGVAAKSPLVAPSGGRLALFQVEALRSDWRGCDSRLLLKAHHTVVAHNAAAPGSWAYATLLRGSWKVTPGVGRILVVSTEYP